MTTDPDQNSHGSRRWFPAAAALVTLVALAMRGIYLFAADTPIQIAGDINEYVNYARNLGEYGVYSSAAPGAAAPAPDGFRPPGYPLFLLLPMKLAGFGPAWLPGAQALQVLFSSATVLLTMLLGREWLKPGFAVAAGALLAVWPHHVVFASTLLSETMLGFSVMLALWLTAVAWRRQSPWLALAAGLAFGYASLVNTLVVLFPVALLALGLLRRHPKIPLTLAAGLVAMMAAWSTMGPAQVEGGRSNAHRAQMNFVQGSWPLYHAAWRARGQHESAQKVIEAIDEEIILLAQSPREGLAEIRTRMAHAPLRYASWYLLEKPFLLWAWDIRLGSGGFHFLTARASPYDNQPVFRATAAMLRLTNPLLFALAGLAVFAWSRGWLPKSGAPFAPVMVATFVVYVTVLHTILQAEPRYSIPYRPEQLLLAMGGLSLLSSATMRLIAWVFRRRNGNE